MSANPRKGRKNRKIPTCEEVSALREKLEALMQTEMMGIARFFAIESSFNQPRWTEPYTLDSADANHDKERP